MYGVLIYFDVSIINLCGRSDEKQDQRKYNWRLSHEGACGERRYSSYSFSTSVLDGVSSQRHSKAAL
jgi:hypothetical protein